jgi:hypothetical protein
MDVLAEPTRTCLRRLAEVAAHTTLEAINNNEDATSNDQTQYQMN